MSNSDCLTHSLAHFSLSVYNPSMSFVTPPEVRSIREQARSGEFKSCTAIPLLYAGGAGNGRVKFRCHRIAAGAE